MAEFNNIRAFLKRVRTRLGIVTAAEGLAFLALALLGLAAAAALAAWVGDGTQLAIVRTAAIGAAVVAIVAGVLRYVILPWRRLRHDTAIARHIEAASEELRGGVLSCVELEASLDEIRESGRFSVGLIAALAADTSKRLERVKPADLVSWEQPRRLSQALLLAVVVLGTVVFLFPAPFTEGARALLFGIPPAHARPVAAPFEEREIVVGDITYTLSYPAYTELPSRVLRNTAGDLAALVGTHVHIRTRPLVRAASAALIFDADPEHPVPLQVSDDGELTGELTVKENGLFRFRIESTDGITIVERTRRVLEAQPDAPPTVDLLKPTEDLEVRTDNPVRLYFSSADDFGIGRIDVVTEKVDSGEPPLRRRIANSGGERTFVGEGVVDLKQLALEPGEAVACWLEVYDNNTLAAEPQRTRSRKVHIKLHSVEEQHNENIDAQRLLLDLMIDVLADRLESPIEYQKLTRYDGSVDAQGLVVKRSTQLIAAIRKVAAALEADPIARDGVDAVLRDMAGRYDAQLTAESAAIKVAVGETRTPERVRLLSELFRLNEAGIAELEADIPILDDLVTQQFQREMVDRARELKQAQRELVDLLTEYKKSGDEAVRMELQRRIAQLAKKIERLSADMRRNTRVMPYENINMDALEPGERTTGLRDMRSTLQKMQDLVREGKIDDAMALAESLGQDMQTFTEELEQDLGAVAGEAADRDQAEMQALSSELEKAVNRQDSIQQQTGKLDEAARQELSEVIQKELAPKIAREMERIREIQKRLDRVDADELHADDRKDLEELEKALQDLRANLSQEDLGQALRLAREAADELRNLEREVNIGTERMRERDGRSRRVRKREQNLRHIRRTRPMAQKLAQNLEEMMPDADDLLDRREQRKIDRLAEHQQRNAEKIQRVRQKLEQLEGKRSGDTPPTGKSPLHQALDRAEQAMRDAKQRLQEHQPGRARGHGKQALDQLKEAQNKLQEQMGKKQSGSDAPGVGPQRKPVDIPDAERYTVPKEFRDQLLRSLKERAPRRYERLIEQYYEALVQ